MPLQTTHALTAMPALVPILRTVVALETMQRSTEDHCLAV
jgi:hypothetical protein